MAQAVQDDIEQHNLQSEFAFRDPIDASMTPNSSHRPSEQLGGQLKLYPSGSYSHHTKMAQKKDSLADHNGNGQLNQLVFNTVSQNQRRKDLSFNPRDHSQSPFAVKQPVIKTLPSAPATSGIIKHKPQHPQGAKLKSQLMLENPKQVGTGTFPSKHPASQDLNGGSKTLNGNIMKNQLRSRDNLAFQQ